MAIKDQPPDKNDDVTRLQVNVRLVLARVVVRDAHGNAVGNLRKEDFELFDNGKPQDISHFDVEHLAAEPTTAPVTAETNRAPATSEPVAKPLSVPVRYIAYLFDDLHLNFENISLFRKAAERRMDALPATDRVAIFSTSGQVIVDFTDDRVKLHAVLENFQPRPLLGGEEFQKCPDISLYMADLIVNKNDPTVLQTAINDYVNCSGEINSALTANILQNARTFAFGTATQVLNVGEHDSRLTLGVLRSAVQRILAMPGQRTLVLVSPGFLTPDLDYDYNEIIERALRAQVTINTLDARGLYVVIPYGDASHAGVPDTTVRGQSFTPVLHAVLDTQTASAQSDILAVLAYSTGGNFFHNNNDMDEGFRRVADAPEFSYVLGFAPQNLKLDGKFHSLKVSLKLREKYDVQARRGYFAPNHKEDPVEEAQREIEDEVHSSEELHGLPVELHTQFFKASDDTAKLTVLARVDVRRLHYKKADGRNQNNMTLVAAVFDRNGNFIQASQKLLEMRWKDETLQAKLASGITLRSSFDVKPGRYLVRLVARDTEQQLMSAENGAVEIP